MALSPEQIAVYERDGCLVVEDVVTRDELAAMQRQIADWAGEASTRGENFGETVDGRPRFDLAPAKDGKPATLRRVNNPAEVSDAYMQVMASSAMTEMIADLIGPDVKHHHTKINLKLPGTATEVGFHQDFPYTPHSNADVVTALLMLDDMTEENGCLEVVPGSHTRGQISLYQDDRFTGTISDEEVAKVRPEVRPVTGKAGSVCFMHTLLLHGSAANLSDKPRGLFISVYSAADAVPLAPSPVPSSNEGMIVAGKASRNVRIMEGMVELPEQYKESSFFDVQQRNRNNAA